MFIRRSFFVVCVGLLVLVGCQAAPEATPLPVAQNGLTARALTSVVPTPTHTAVVEVTPTLKESTATTKPTELAIKPSATPRKATAVPAKVTPTAAVVDVSDASFCHQSFGPGSLERFSATLDSIKVELNGGVAQLVINFDSVTGRIKGEAACLAPEAASVAFDSSALSVIRVSLPTWAHDQAWSDSRRVLVLPVSAEAVPEIEEVVVLQQQDSSSGLVVELALREPLPYTVDVTDSQVVVSFGAQSDLADDALGKDQGRPDRPTLPFVFTQGGEIWLLEGDRVRSISSTMDIESDIALGPNGSQIAFCRSAVDVPAEFGALWISDLDGANERLVADVGGCADPAWSFDGSSLWFSAPWSDVQPLNYRLWSVELASGELQPRSELDMWSRTHTVVLPKGEVLTLGDDGQSTKTILLLKDGSYSNVGRELLRSYIGVDTFVVSPDNATLAVAALRADGGADLVLLDLDGTIQDVLGTSQWWSRPLEWTDDGQLYYLVQTCRAGQVMSYELRLLADTDTLLAEGQSLAAIGDTATVDDRLLYVRETRSTQALRGPVPQVTGPSALWVIDTTGQRQELLATTRAITGLQ